MKEMARVNFNQINWDAIKNTVRVNVRPVTDDNVITFRKADLEEYCYFKPIGIPGIVKVTPEILSLWNIPAEIMWETALENTKNAVEIRTLVGIVNNLSGNYKMPDDVGGNIVITNKEKYHGAGAISCNDVLNFACGLLNTDAIYIIPSSIHEIIVLDANEYDAELLNTMVIEINETEVAPEERLANHVYYFSMETKMIEIR